jgi:hypothetical protein
MSIAGRLAVPLVAALLAPSVASAALLPERPVSLVSIGGTETYSGFDGMAQDGSRSWFDTTEAIPGTGDGDFGEDVYERSADGALRLVSVGTPTAPAYFLGASADGRSVFYQTQDPVPGTGDIGTAWDTFARVGGHTILVTPGTTGDASYERASSDGSRVVFGTREPIDPHDTGTGYDLYETTVATGAVRLVSKGDGGNAPTFVGLSADGSRVFFSTAEALLPADTDTFVDIYERDASGALHLDTPGTGTHDATPTARAVSADGRHLWFTAADALDGAAGSQWYLYDNGPTGVHLVAGSGNGPAPTVFGATADGARVFFTTSLALTIDDGDAAPDVYERDADGSAHLLSPGTSGFPAIEGGVSRDGGTVWYSTYEQLLPGQDTDHALDVYEHDADGTTRLASPGVEGVDASFLHGAADGSRAWFQTTAAIAGTGDIDGTADVYEHPGNGVTRLISAGTEEVFASFAGASDDGSRVLWMTPESVPGTGDSDLSVDVYQTAWTAPRLIPPPVLLDASARVGAPLRCTPGVVGIGEAATVVTDWVRDGAPIVGSAGTTYIPRPTDAGRTLGCRTIAASLVGRDQATTATTRTVRPFAATPAAITGAARAGATVTCHVRFLGAGRHTRTSYRWLRGTKAIARATAATYRLVQADRGTRLRCTAAATNVGGATVSTSPARRIA